MGKVPIELSATLLAASIALLAATGASLPTWAIFLAWAAASSFSARKGAGIGALLLSLSVGSLFGAAALLLQQFFVSQISAGEPPTPTTTAIEALGAILIVNPALVLLGRVSQCSFIPRMFIGSSIVLGAYFGKFGPGPADIYMSCLSAFAMIFIGVFCAKAVAHFSGGPTVQDEHHCKGCERSVKA